MRLKIVTKIKGKLFGTFSFFIKVAYKSFPVERTGRVVLENDQKLNIFSSKSTNVKFTLNLSLNNCKNNIDLSDEFKIYQIISTSSFDLVTFLTFTRKKEVLIHLRQTILPSLMTVYSIFCKQFRKFHSNPNKKLGKSSMSKYLCGEKWLYVCLASQ